MRSRSAPDASEYSFNRRALANDVQVKTWLQRLRGTSNNTLTQRDIAFVLSEVHKRRPDDFRADLVLDELRRTCPVLSYPELTDSVEDLGLMFSQPEMIRFWGRVQGERNRKGPSPCFGWTKALLAVLAMTGKTTHGKDAFDDLRNIPALREMFAATENTATDLAHHENWTDAPRPERWQQLPDYSSVMRNIPRLTSAIRSQGVKANVEMLRALREQYPDVGRRLIIDGKAIATWFRRRGRRRTLIVTGFCAVVFPRPATAPTPTAAAARPRSAPTESNAAHSASPPPGAGSTWSRCLTRRQACP
jgi:hypothetical protein